MIIKSLKEESNWQEKTLRECEWGAGLY